MFSSKLGITCFSTLENLYRLHLDICPLWRTHVQSIEQRLCLPEDPLFLPSPFPQAQLSSQRPSLMRAIWEQTPDMLKHEVYLPLVRWWRQVQAGHFTRFVLEIGVDTRCCGKEEHGQRGFPWMGAFELLPLRREIKVGGGNGKRHCEQRKMSLRWILRG